MYWAYTRRQLTLTVNMYVKLLITAVLLLSICYVSTDTNSVSVHEVDSHRSLNNINKQKERLKTILFKAKTWTLYSIVKILKEHKCFDDILLKSFVNKTPFYINKSFTNTSHLEFPYFEKLLDKLKNQLILKAKDKYCFVHAKMLSSFIPGNTTTANSDISEYENRIKDDSITESRLKRETEDYNDGNETSYTSYNETGLENETNSTEDFLRQIKDFIFPRTWTWVLIFFHTAVFVIGLVGNILVCVAVYRNHTMRTVTNYFIVNLAVADFLVILLCLPPSVIWDVTMTWFLGVIMCKIVLYLQTVSVTVSVLTLTFISVDRWYAICFPLKFKSTTGRAKTAIGIIWLLALIFDIPELVVYRTVPNKMVPNGTIYFTQCEPDWSDQADRDWTILKMILLYAIPLIFMTVAYCQIIRVLWKSGNVHQHSLDISGGRQVNTFTMNTNTSTEGQLRSRRKAAKMLVAVVVMFAVCYFPVHLLNVLRTTVSMSNSETNRAFFLISHWLCYANSAVNPVIYNFMSGKFRKEFRRAFEHCCQPSANNHRGYQLNNLCPKSTEKDSGIGTRSQSRSSKRTLTEVRRLGTIERGFPDTYRTRRQSEKTIVSKIDV